MASRKKRLHVKRTRQLASSSEEASPGAYHLFIGNTLLDNTQLKVYGRDTSSGEWFEVHTADQTAFEQIAAYSLDDFPERLGGLVFLSPFDWAEFFEVRIPATDLYGTDEAFDNILFVAQVGVDKWRKPYFARDYYQAFSNQLKGDEGVGVDLQPIDDADLNEGFMIAIKGFSSDKPINPQFKRCGKILYELHKRVEQAILSGVSPRSILMYFDFPEATRVACEQYLLYFVQFLKDLGVHATSEISHEFGQTLFSISPTDPTQALNKVRDALDVYLRFPSGPITEMDYGDIAINRLLANIHRLRSDLLLSQAVVQAQSTTIEAQRMTIRSLYDLAKCESPVGSLRDASHRTKDKNVNEELLGGTFSITPYEGKGFTVNLPEMFRRLKEFLRPDKNDN